MPYIGKYAYHHTPLKTVPRGFALDDKNGGKVVLEMKYLEDEQIPQLSELIREAAEGGLNVGIDEYDYNDLSLLDTNVVFVLSEQGKDKIQCAIGIGPDMHQRSMRPHTAEIKIFVNGDVHPKKAYKELLSVGQDLVLDLKELLYDSAVVSIFATCTDCMEVARKDEFYPVAILPQQGWVKGHKLPQDSFQFYKEYNVKVPLRPLPELMEFLSRIFADEGFDAEKDILQIPFLPVEYVFRNGTRAIIRNCLKGEDERVFELLQEEMKKGIGFTFDDFPSLSYFRGGFIPYYHLIVAEDPTNKAVIGFLLVGKSDYQRTKKEKHTADTSLFIEPKFRSKGFGSELMEIGLGIMKDLGYALTVSDFLMKNGAMHQVTTFHGYAKVGVMPKGAYMEGEGWIDSVYSYKHLSQQESFLHAMTKTK